MQASGAKMEEAENVYNDMEDDVNAQARRVVLLEEEVNIGEEKLANTITKLAQMSKEADNIVKVIQILRILSRFVYFILSSQNSRLAIYYSKHL